METRPVKNDVAVNFRPPPGAALSTLAALHAAGGAQVLDFAEGTARFSLVLIDQGGLVLAYVNQCPHARWPLETFDGRLLRTPEGAILCAAHGAVFDAVTGACAAGPAAGRSLAAFPVSVRDGAILAA
jgi:nitrite reductase/ring-hydroxylating ferredoxin subunit